MLQPLNLTWFEKPFLEETVETCSSVHNPIELESKKVSVVRVNEGSFEGNMVTMSWFQKPLLLSVSRLLFVLATLESYLLLYSYPPTMLYKPSNLDWREVVHDTTFFYRTIKREKRFWKSLKLALVL